MATLYRMMLPFKNPDGKKSGNMTSSYIDSAPLKIFMINRIGKLTK
jgi:hypothetical protein